jgi:hypothetical protein
MFPAPDFQVWMPLVVAGLLLWFLYLWLTRSDRSARPRPSQYD